MVPQGQRRPVPACDVTRYARTRRRARHALCVTALLLALPLTAQGAEQVRLSPEQAHQVARQALVQGNPQLAYDLALGLLQRNPHDGGAHFIIARAHSQMRQPQKGRRAARLAYRHATEKNDKFHAAQLAAKLAVEADRPGAAQFWLRRSLINLPDPAMRDRVVKDYQILRRLSPWEYRLNLSFAPSDNLNNGADSPYSLIDGVPVVGLLSGSAQALSGVAGQADLSVRYRLAHSKTHSRHIGLRYFGKRVRLSDAARDLAPNVQDSDLAFDYAEIGLNEVRKATTGSWRYGLSVGQSWSGGEKFQRSARINLSRSLPIGARTGLSLSTQLERLRHEGSRPDVHGVTLSGHFSHRTEDWGDWTLNLSAKRENSDNINADRDQLAARLSWAPDLSARPALANMAPVFTLGASTQRYDSYNAGLMVPGGRRDETVFGQVEVTLKALDYGGFAPSLNLRSKRSTSNVSRFDTRETTVSLGFRSTF